MLVGTSLPSHGPGSYPDSVSVLVSAVFGTIGTWPHAIQKACFSLWHDTWRSSDPFSSTGDLAARLPKTNSTIVGSPRHGKIATSSHTLKSEVSLKKLTLSALQLTRTRKLPIFLLPCPPLPWGCRTWEAAC